MLVAALTLPSIFVFLLSQHHPSADIVRDFSNQVVQEEWTKFRATVLSRQHERSQQLSKAAQQQQHEREVFNVQRQQRIQNLDATIDDLNAKFSDGAVALEYDAKALYRKFETAGTLQDPSKSRSKVAAPVPCLGPRAHWMDCAIKYQVDTRPCDAYLATLERCVQETVVKLARGGGGDGSPPPQSE
jgi:hypothetical protein